MGTDGTQVVFGQIKHPYPFVSSADETPCCTDRYLVFARHERPGRLDYVLPKAACAAARRAMGTRYGDALT